MPKSPYVQLAEPLDQDVYISGQDFVIEHNSVGGKNRYYVRVPAEWVIDRLRKRGLVYIRPEAV